MVALLAFLEDHHAFALDSSKRVVTFQPTGKHFWAWDLISLKSFASGATCARYLAPAGCFDEIDGLIYVDVASLPYTWIRVPTVIATRIQAIAVALYNQLVLCSICQVSFESLGMVVHYLRKALPGQILAQLRRQSGESADAKHSFMVVRGLPHAVIGHIDSAHLCWHDQCLSALMM